MAAVTAPSLPPMGRLIPPDWVKPISAGGRAMLDLLLKRGPQSQAALSRLLDLSQPSVHRLVSGFENDGMLHTSSRAPTGRGNPSVMIALEADFAYGLGIALVADAVSMALVDFTGSVRFRQTVAMPDMCRVAVAAQLVKMKRQLIKATKIDPSRIVGAGVGFSGFLAGSPPSFNPPDLLSDWLGIDVAETLVPSLGVSVICDNDGTTAAIAESLLGVGRTCPTFAYCHLTNGFGGGLVIDGSIIRGTLGNAADFGGVWALLADGYPNLERLRIHIESHGMTFDTIEDMVQAIEPGTAGVDTWVAEAIGPFTTLARLLGHIVAPEKVVIGGRLPGWLADQLAGAITMPFVPTRNDMPFPLPAVVAREVDDDSVAIGAGIMPLQALFLA
ncbi:transcriptional regulator [Nostoc sp. 3335mG]|nr:transcriptional regulator [Nostoc sp. 3335mG]